MDEAMINKPGENQGNGGMQGLPPIAVRSQRVQTVVNCQVLDNVPEVPSMSCRARDVPSSICSRALAKDSYIV